MSSFEFLEALAALTSKFKCEVVRLTHIRRKGKGIPLYEVLHAKASEVNLQWYFNNLRLRQQLPWHYRALLPSGTSSNESLHHEVNSWFVNQQEVHRESVVVQLEANWIGKIAVHNASLYSPQLRQLPQATILSVIASSWKFDVDGAWAQHCQSDVSLPLANQRAHTAKRLREKHSPRRIMTKRPASAFPVAMKR